MFLTDPKCRVCTHGKRAEIERVIRDKSAPDAQDWMISNCIQPLLTLAELRHHHKEHGNPSSDAAEIVTARNAAMASSAKAEKEYNAQLGKAVDDYDLLNEMRDLCMGTVRSLAGSAARGSLTKSQADTWATALRECRNCIRDKHEMQKGKKVNVQGTIQGVADLLGLQFESGTK